MRAWTLGHPAAYEEAIRIPGNAKGIGGIVFRTRDEAVRWAGEHTVPWEPYEVELPASFARVTTRQPKGMFLRYHFWQEHKAPSFDCPQCRADDRYTLNRLDYDALIEFAPFVIPEEPDAASQDSLNLDGAGAGAGAD